MKRNPGNHFQALYCIEPGRIVRQGAGSVSMLLLSILFLWPGIAKGQQSDSVLLNEFDAALVHFAGSDPLRHASWSFTAIDVNSGERYRGVNDHLALIPASTLKPYTSGAVLSMLGSDYRFTTSVMMGGEMDQDGVLHGNLYMVGGGDPTLGSERFGAEANIDSLFLRILISLQDLGIHTISGYVMGDGSIFGTMPVTTSWQYEDIGNHYGAGAYGLSAWDNRVTYTFQPGRRPGDPAPLAGTTPDVSYLNVINEVTTGHRGSGDRVNIFGAPYTNQHWLRGTVPAGVASFDVGGALPDPPYQVAFELHNYLVENGISITQPPTTHLRVQWMGETDTLIRRTLMVHQSPPLEEIVYWVNFRSVNMYAEALVKILGHERGEAGTTAEGLRVIERFWAGRGVDLSGLNLKDGSGLSRKNIITTQTLARALVVMTQDHSWESFYASFPVAGETGSVANRFRRGAARGNLRAKSGTLENVRGFSGYANTASGRTLAYALVVNNYCGTRNNLMNEIEILLRKMCEIDD